MEDLEPVVVAVDAKVRVCADIKCPEPSEAFDAPSPPGGAFGGVEGRRCFLLHWKMNQSGRVRRAGARVCKSGLPFADRFKLTP